MTTFDNDSTERPNLEEFGTGSNDFKELPIQLATAGVVGVGATTDGIASIDVATHADFSRGNSPLVQVIDEVAFMPVPDENPLPEDKTVLTKIKPKFDIYQNLIAAAEAKGDGDLAARFKAAKRAKQEEADKKALFKSTVVADRRKKAKAAKKSKKANRK